MTVATRISIGTLMAVVFFVAVDFGIVRALWETSPHVAVAIVTLPMINLLLLTVPKLRKGTATRPFWAGFQAVGWAAVLAVGDLALCHPDTLFWPIDLLETNPWFKDQDAHLTFLITVAVVLYTTPQLLVALAAGRLSAKYRVVVVR
jgi:hypothetical protein